MRDGRAESNVFIAICHVKFPAEPCNCVSLAHEEAVAEFRVGVRAIHNAHDPFAAAVGDFKQHGAVAFIHVFRFEQVEVGGEFHLTLCVTRCFVKVNDLAVVRVGGINAEVNAAQNLLVRTGESKSLSGVVFGGGGDFHADNPGRKRVRQKGGGGPKKKKKG